MSYQAEIEALDGNTTANVVTVTGTVVSASMDGTQLPIYRGQIYLPPTPTAGFVG